MSDSTTFERRVDFFPAYDFRRPTGPQYGIGGMRAVFYLIGPKGAVQWMIGLPFYTASVRPEMAGWSWREDEQGRPTGWDLGYHAREAQYDGQTVLRDDCHVVGGPCYYDGSGLNAELLIEGFVNGGTEWLWPALEEYYRAVFDGGPWPSFAWLPQTHPLDRAKPTTPARSEERRAGE